MSRINQFRNLFYTLILLSITYVYLVPLYAKLFTDDRKDTSQNKASGPTQSLNVILHNPSNQEGSNAGRVVQPPRKNKNSRLILGYTMFYGYPFKVSLRACQHKCTWTNDKQKFNESDGVVFHLFNNPSTHDFVIQHLPKRFDQKQKWILMDREPQGFYMREQLQNLDDMFNLTVSFQYDSDVVIPYGLYYNKTAQTGRDRDFLEGKTRMVVWAVSNCVTSSRREDFVAELKKYIDVDIFGKCPGGIRDHGNTYYARNGLAKSYKFYLALENSDCVDYISEKFWNSLTAGIIPIVRGKRADYKKLAPPNSYIHADKYGSAKDLADYLKLVASNSTLYNSFHEWRKYYRARDTFITPNTNWACELCERVHNSEAKTVSISELFSEESRCHMHRDYSQRQGERVKDLTGTRPPK